MCPAAQANYKMQAKCGLLGSRGLGSTFSAQFARRLCRSVGLPFKARSAKTLVFGLALLCLFFDYLANDAGCLVQWCFGIGSLSIEHAFFL